VRPRRRRRDGEGLALVQLALLGEAMAETPEVGVFVWSDDRRFVAANSAACALTGLTREELLELRVGELTPNGAAAKLEQVKAGSPAAGESEIVRRDGSRVEIDWVTFRTTVAGLPYLASVCWPRRA
jgi:PAS domain S-box-containing protein